MATSTYLLRAMHAKGSPRESLDATVHDLARYQV